MADDRERDLDVRIKEVADKEIQNAQPNSTVKALIAGANKSTADALTQSLTSINSRLATLETTNSPSFLAQHNPLDPSNWKLESVSHQFEYWSLQAVKLDLEGLSVTDDGLSIGGVQVVRVPWKSWIEKRTNNLMSKLADRFSVLNNILPESLLQERIDNRQNEAIRFILQQLRQSKETERRTVSSQRNEFATRRQRHAFTGQPTNAARETERLRLLGEELDRVREKTIELERALG